MTLTRQIQLGRVWNPLEGLADLQGRARLRGGHAKPAHTDLLQVGEALAGVYGRATQRRALHRLPAAC